MGKTPIEWTDFSINPIRARHRITGAVGHYCEKITAGCKNCYASRLQSRFRMPAFNEQRGDDNIEVFLDESKLEEVLRRKKPTKYFWCDMTDMFGAWVPDEMIDKCFAVMALTPWHTHQVLTKRPERMREYLTKGFGRIADTIIRMRRERGDNGVAVPLQHVKPGAARFPLPNVWCGVSCEDQKTADKRIPLLLETPAAVRFLSCEPLLGPLNVYTYLNTKFIDSACYAMTDRVDWVICGGESGAGARPMHSDWARWLRDQCEAAGVPFFMKQWGEWIPISQCGNGDGPGCSDYYSAKGAQSQVLQLDGRIENAYPPGAMLVFKAGKKAAGRLLDGKEHNEMPEVKR